MSRPPEGTVLLNVCIIPSDEVGAECVQISRSLRSESTLFTLGDGKFAHMTVFMARFPEEAVDQVVEKVKNVIAGVDSFECEHTGYFLTEGRYVEVSYRRSEPLMGLHEKLIEELSDLRANPGTPYEEGYFTPYTAEQRKYAEETGYDLARDLYRPHITLTRYKEGHSPKNLPALPEANLSFNLLQVCVYKADDNGAVYEQLAEFKIS